MCPRELITKFEVIYNVVSAGFLSLSGGVAPSLGERGAHLAPPLAAVKEKINR